MRSFADYRKRELMRSIPFVDAREAINNYFEIFRYDMLEAVQLPTLMIEGNITFNAAFENARKADYALLKEYVEDLTYVCKCHFYDSVISEAEAAVAADPYVDFKAELVANVRQMFDELKRNVAATLGSARSVTPPAEDEDPAAPSVPASSGRIPDPSAPSSGRSPASPSSGGGPAPSPAPASGGGGRIPDPSAPSSGGRPAPAPASGGGGGGGRIPDPSAPSGSPRYSSSRYGGFDQPRQGDLPDANPDGFQPAAYGSVLNPLSWRPRDGWGAGLGRLWNNYVKRPFNWLTRGVRNAWHGHSKDNPRYMHRETTEMLDRLFLENAEEVLTMIDDFEKRIIQYIDTQIDAFATKMKGATPASPAAPGSSPTLPVSGGAGGGVPSRPASIPSPTGTSPAGTLGVGGRDTERAAAAGVAVATGKVKDDKDGGKDDKSAGIDKKTEMKDSAAALNGAQMLGITINDVGALGGWGKVKPGSFVLPEGKAASGWASLRDFVFEKVWPLMQNSVDGKAMLQAYLEEKRKGGKKMTQPGQVDRRKLVAQWLGINLSTPKQSLVSGLAGYYRKASGIPSISSGPTDATDPATTSAAPGAEAPATTPAAPGAGGASSSAAGTLPVTGRGEGPASTPTEPAATWPNDARAFMNQFMKKHPAEFAVLKSKAEGKSLIAAVEELLDKGKSPDAIAAHFLKLGSNKTAPAATTPAPAPAAGEESGRAAPAATTPATAPASTPTEPAAAPAAGGVASAVRERLKTEIADPQYKEIAHLLDDSHLSDEELNAAIGDADISNEDGMQKALDAAFEAISKKLGVSTEPTTTTEPPAPEGEGSPTTTTEPPAPEGEGSPTTTTEPPAPAATEPPVAGKKKQKGKEKKKKLGSETLMEMPELSTLMARLRSEYDEIEEGKTEVIKKTKATMNSIYDMADNDGPEAALAALRATVEEMEDKRRFGGVSYGADKDGGKTTDDDGSGDDPVNNTNYMAMNKESFQNKLNKFRKLLAG